MSIEFGELGVFQDAYLDYLEGSRKEPPVLEDLAPEFHRKAELFIKSIEAARGIDPYTTPPSVEDLIKSRIEKAYDEEQVSKELETHLRDAVDAKAMVTRDTISIAVGLASTYVIQARGMQMRFVPEKRSENLRAAIIDRAPDIAKVFSTFPDCHAVLYGKTESRSKAVVLDRGDVYRAIETPSGQSKPPCLRRNVASATWVCEAWFNEVIPEFKPFFVERGNVSSPRELVVDTLHVARLAVEEVSRDGKRAKIVAKRDAWGVFGEREAEVLATIVEEAQAGSLSDSKYLTYLDQLSFGLAA